MNNQFVEQLFSLEGKNAIVTGASSGLGRQFAKTLAMAGANVAILARRKELLDTLAKEIKELGREAIPIQTDVTDPESVKNAFRECDKHFKQIDVLVNNAGGGSHCPLLHAPLKDWDQCVDLNLRSVWVVTREAASRMVKTKTQGSIINIASINGDRMPAPEAAAYDVAKAGVIHLTRSLVPELSPHNIRINAIAPGFINTHGKFDPKITALRKKLLGKTLLDTAPIPEQLGGALLYLASNAASAYTTGITMTIDGGVSAAVVMEE